MIEKWTKQGIITFSTAKKMEDNVHLCQSAFYLILELKLHKIIIFNSQ